MTARLGWIPLAVYGALIVLPILWLLRVSLGADAAPGASFALLPAQMTLQNYRALFADGLGAAFAVGLLAAAGSALIAVILALPAAYALARYRFSGDGAFAFWLLAGRFLPLAALAGPAGGLYAALGLSNAPLAVALAQGLFNLGVAAWMIEAAIRSVPRRIDEAAEMDGYGFPAFFFAILLPQIARRVGFAALVCFIFSWIETALAGAVAAASRPIGPALLEASQAGAPPGVLAAAAVLCLAPGLVLAWPLRRHIANGFALGRA